MKFASGRVGILLSVFAAFALIAGGCGKTDGTGGQAKDKPGKETDKPVQVAEKKGEDDSGWWCNEHGVQEEACSMCSSKAAAEFKKKGDWCKEHNRAESQCFICHPDYEAKFAAQYEAKFGKKPPVPEENRRKPEETTK